MLVQGRSEVFRVIRQNDHALLAGRLAREWIGPRGDDAAAPGVALAIALHDIAWAEVDREPVFDAASGGVVPFTAWEDRDREALQIRGLELLESVDPLAGLLGSLHYARFLDADEYPEFAAREAGRQVALMRELGIGDGDAGLERARLQLRHLDFVSLFVCLTGPGTTGAPAWLTAERIGEAPDGTRYTLARPDGGTLACEPFPYRRPFTVMFPYRDLRPPFADAAALGAAWSEAPPRFYEVRIRPA